MAIKIAESNNLLILGVSDGAPGENGTSPDLPNYKVFIVYSEYPSGKDPNGNSSFGNTINTYIGIYIGPENEEQPTDAEKYEWSKYGGESSYIDIRYSNDGEEFTENNGLEPGSWIGFYITEDPSVLDPNYIPIWSNYEPWTRIESAA